MCFICSDLTSPRFCVRCLPYACTHKPTKQQQPARAVVPTPRPTGPSPRRTGIGTGAPQYFRANKVSYWTAPHPLFVLHQVTMHRGQHLTPRQRALVRAQCDLLVFNWFVFNWFTSLHSTQHLVHFWGLHLFLIVCQTLLFLFATEFVLQGPWRVSNACICIVYIVSLRHKAARSKGPRRQLYCINVFNSMLHVSLLSSTVCQNIYTVSISKSPTSFIRI